MHRRDFVKTSAAGAAAATLLGPTPGASTQRSQSARLVVDGLDTSIVNEGFLELLETGGVDCVHKSMGDVASYAPMYSFLHANRDRIVPATTVREIRQAKADGKRAMVFGVQHANLLEALVPKDPSGSYETIEAGLQAYYDLGLRIHSICYNVANIFGGGCMDHDVPLTRAGHRLVEEIHARNIVLDVGGHTGERTSLDAVQASSGVPVVCSHTNVAALNPNARAVSDRLIEAIAGTGGVVGITAISDFHVRNAKTAPQHGSRSPQASMSAHLDQYEYVRDLVGIDHVALGPDFVWGWGDTFDHQAAHSITFPPEALSDGPVGLVKGYEDISKLPNVIRGLTERGWSDSDLDKLLGGNWLRVWERVWGE